jgi:hypothetical protein
VTKILDIIGGQPVHVLAVDGHVISDAMAAPHDKPPKPPKPPKDDDIRLLFVQSGRSTDLFVVEAANRKFCQDLEGQIWYSQGGFMSWENRKPVDISTLMDVRREG